MRKILHEKFSREIIGAAMTVLNQLKPGLDEKLCDRALAIVVSCFTDTHVAQMIGYLSITRLDLALLLNFKNSRLERKRVLRPGAEGGETPLDLHA